MLITNRNRSIIAAIVAAVCLFPVSAGVLRAADGTWEDNADGNWSDTNRWVDGIVADGADSTAYLTANITDHRWITLDTDRTIGHIVTGHPDSYRCFNLRGDTTLTLQATLSGPPTITTNNAMDIRTKIAGNAGFTKYGDEFHLWLHGSNTYTGVTTVAEDNLRLSNDLALGAHGAGNETIVKNGSAVYLLNVDVPESFTISGNGNWADRGALYFGWSNASTIGGDVTLDGDAGIEICTSGNAITGAVSLPDEAVLTVIVDNASDTLALEGVISGSGSVVKKDSGVLTLSGTNTYTGGTMS
ncbi:MAG: hypothetical protein K8S55_09165 [Phycisphaerae bacterium]|nr:hypothetical protein [Phycisphaerae bacterium]